MFVKRIVIRITKMIHNSTVAPGNGRPVMSELSLYLKNESEFNSPVDMAMIFNIERPAYINGESCIENNMTWVVNLLRHVCMHCLLYILG